MNVHEYLTAKSVPFQEIRHEPTFQASQSARTIAVPAQTFGKSVLLDVDGSPVMAVVPASCFVDLKKVKKLFHAHHCHLASEERCQKLFPESEFGAWPPFGSMRHIPTLMDEKLLNSRQGTFESDRLNESIRMNMEDFEHVEHPIISQISRTKTMYRSLDEMQDLW
jgi:prolyl-tRNA editing enzyme YbaK/EbsC (Cys-tRNA(Pro) deacylase)